MVTSNFATESYLLRNSLRGYELLQRPAPAEPFATPDAAALAAAGDVEEIGIADDGVSLPVEHGIDGFGQFGAAALVDTERVDPYVGQIISQCQFCAVQLGLQWLFV